MRISLRRQKIKCYDPQNYLDDLAFMTINSTNRCSISLNDLALAVHLGVTDQERSQLQTVTLSLTIHFDMPPVACLTDNLHDTYCYDTLVTDIKNNFSSKTFNLLEHLGYSIYQHAKAVLAHDCAIQIALQKLPVIAGLQNGVTFHYGDAQPA